MTIPLHFQWPQLLCLLWSVPMLVLAYLALLRRRRQPVLRYASLAIVRQALAPGQAWRRHLPPALLLLATVVLLLAAARPQAVLPLATHQATVILAVDVSLSMETDDILPSRLAAAREAAKAFVRQLPSGVRVGVVSFAATAHTVQQPTHDREALLAAIDRLHLQHGTAMGSGIVLALSALHPGAAIEADAVEGGFQKTALTATPARAEPVPPGSDASGAIVLLTDGRSTYGMSPLDAADLAARRGVRIHAVGLGTVVPGTPEDESWAYVMQLDEDMLQTVTRATHGEYFHAASAGALLQVYEQLGARMQLQMRETELAAPLSLAALLLLCGGAGLSLLWFRRSL